MNSKQEILDARILIVDDQQSNVLLLEQMLREAGYSDIASTMDPHTVCELHRKNHYCLILLDIQMPGMDGFQVMKELQKVETDGYVPILVITAHANHKQKALAAGARDFVSKPFDLVEVQTRIHNLLEVRLLYKKLEQFNKVLEHYNHLLGQTVLKQTAELRASEERILHLTALSSDWYCEQDENGSLTKVRGPAHEIPGIRVNDTMEKTREDHGALWNKTVHESPEANPSAIQSSGDSVYSRANPDGSIQYLKLSEKPIFDSFGRFTGNRGTFQRWNS